MDNNGESDSAAVTYAMQNLPPIIDAAFSKTKHTVQVGIIICFSYSLNILILHIHYCLIIMNSN